MSNAQAVALAVAVLCGWGIPTIVDLLTKSALPGQVKAGLAFALSALAGALAQTVFAPGQRWTDYLLAVAVSFTNAMVAHYAGTSSWIEQATAGFGIGPKPPVPVKAKPSKQSGHVDAVAVVAVAALVLVLLVIFGVLT